MPHRIMKTPYNKLITGREVIYRKEFIIDSRTGAQLIRQNDPQ